ncbi:MAG: MlaD family protein [bacterium]
MRDTRKTEIRVGIFTILGILLFVWIFGWAKNLSLTSDKKILLIKFDSVAGLETGDVVTVNGVRAGHVEEIEFNNGSVLVKSNIEPNVDLREDARFYVMMLDLMGGKKIEIAPGSSKVKIDYQKTQIGSFAGDVGTMIFTLNSVQTDLLDIIKEMRVTLNNVNKLLGDENFNAQIKNAVTNMNVAVTTLTALIERNKNDISALITSGKELALSANSMINENKDELKTLLKHIEETVNNSNKLLTKINELVDETKEQKNALGKALYDEQLITDLKDMIKKANEMISVLVEQLKTDGVKVDANIF